jgi:hypothetical protein
MTKKIFILVGSPGSGKTWVANQLRDKYTYVAHDSYGLKSSKEYLMAISAHAHASDKPIVCETPFSLSQIQKPLLERGYEVQPVFILEEPSVTRQRYEMRYQTHKIGQKQMPQGHLTRIETYKERAKELNAPSGTSAEILDYMRNHADKESTVSQRPQFRPQHEAHNAQRNNERNEKAERAQIPDAPTEAVRDVRTWTVGGDIWKKD